jgi:hypothetical protein
MGKMENKYVKEFIDYYSKLGIDHIYIYDNNQPNTEKISDALDKKYLKFVTIYDTNIFHINNQSTAFTTCYTNNYKKFDWFLMIDMDEFLFIINNTLKDYLSNNIFDKCDFIKIHSVLTTDNGLIYYDNRTLFERFKPPYIKVQTIKSLVRGNISGLKYWVHSPIISPNRNITCNNEGKKMYYKNMNFETYSPINIKKAYIIHFRYKSTEEFINKIKRGYNNWFRNKIKSFLLGNIKKYLSINNASSQKIHFIEKSLNISLKKMNNK